MTAGILRAAVLSSVLVPLFAARSAAADEARTTTTDEARSAAADEARTTTTDEARTATSDDARTTTSDEVTRATAKVIIAGDDAEAAVAAASVTEQLDRLGVRAETRRSRVVRPTDVVAAEPGDATMVARVWIDFSAPSEGILYVADRSGSRVLIRRFPRAGRVEIAREAALAALQTAVDALLHGGQIGVSRDEARTELGLPPPPPPPAPPRPAPGAAPRVGATPRTPSRPPPPRRPTPETTLGLGLAYEVGAYADDAFAHGPVVALSVARPYDGRLFALTLTGQYRLPVRATDPPVTLRLESGALRLSAVAQITRTWPLEVRGAIGGGLDVLRADPGLLHLVDATLSPVSRVDPVFRAALIGRAPLMIFARSSLELSLGIDVAPSARSFAVARGDARTVLLAPWPVRPFAMLGVVVP